jgi:hypothetical protein
MIEARVALDRAPGRGRVGLPEMTQHGLHGTAQAVEVEAIEAGAQRLGAARVEVALPVDELHHVVVAPHPVGKAAEIGEGACR